MPPAASISSMPGIRRFSKPVFRKLSRQPRLTSPTGSLAAGCLPGLAGHLERYGNHGLELVHVSDVVDERLRLACVQKADGRRVPRREDGSLGQPVEACSRLAETAIRQVRGLPISGVVASSLPLHAVLPCQHLVETLHARSLDPAQLINGSAPRSGLTETQVVHLANNLETRIRIKRKSRLMKETVCPCSTRLTSGVEPDAGLANPDQKTPDTCGQRHGRVGDPSAGLQHQTRESSHGNMGTHAVSVHHDEGAVQDIEASLLEEQDRRAILDGYGWGGAIPGIVAMVIRTSKTTAQPWPQPTARQEHASSET